MDSPSLRVLVAENQYLIAMEVEQILLDTLDCAVTIVPLARLEQLLGDNVFDIVLLDTAPSRRGGPGNAAPPWSSCRPTTTSARRRPASGISLWWPNPSTPRI